MILPSRCQALASGVSGVGFRLNGISSVPSRAARFYVKLVVSDSGSIRYGHTFLLEDMTEKVVMDMPLLERPEISEH